MVALLPSVIRSPFVAFYATTYVRVAYRHLAGEPVEFSGRVLQHVDRPVSACLHTAQPTGGRPPTHLSAGRCRLRNRCRVSDPSPLLDPPGNS
jgi:hypothetical protein